MKTISPAPMLFAEPASRVLRIGFVTEGDPRDVTGWSGINFFMSKALNEAGCDIVPIHGFKRVMPAAALAKKLWAHVFLRRYYEVRRHPAVLQRFARQIESRLPAARADALFSTGTHLTADCRPGCPVFFWADATVPALFALYPGYDRYWSVGYREALESEKRAVANATAMFFSSAWAAESAVRDLGAAPHKVHVVPFGANFAKEPDAAAAIGAARARSREKLVLLFAGVDWKRKGGSKAVAVARAAALLGIQVELHILGIEPAAAGKDAQDHSGRAGQNPAVVWHGRISKATPEGNRRIEALFSRAHFLLLPTVADCTPMVFAEANAYAVPVVTHRVGGIPTMIRDELNGRMFVADSAPESQAAWMVEIWRDKSRYGKLAGGSRDEYDTRLNWRVGAQRVVGTVRAAMTANGRPGLQS